MYHLLDDSENAADLDTVSLFSNVLLVEDQGAHAQLISRALTGLVGEIRHASNAQEALSILTSDFTELVFCDLHLPDVTGVQLIQEIRRVRPSVPLVVLTSSSNLDDAVHAMREGAWDFMVKRFSDNLKAEISIVLRRIAERKLQQTREISMRAERDAFSLAAYTAQDALAILTERGSVVFSNEAFRKFASLVEGNEVQTPGVNLVDAVAQQSFSVAKSLLSELNKDSASLLWTTELEVCAQQNVKNAMKHNFEFSLSSVSGDSASGFRSVVGHLRYRVLWIRDITRRKEQERFQRDLLATTTHDLKGPLGSILTSAELLCDDSYQPDPKAVNLLTRIASCARSSITIIDELLSARRIQDGVLVVKPRWYSVAEMLEDTVLDYFPMAKAKDITFSAKAVEPSLKIYADKLGLHRVLGNLVSNALKFTPKDGKVELFAEVIPGAVCIGVTDTGPGIEASDRYKLFERFARLDRDTEIEGTGLGLFVTKNIVEAHGGSVEIKSEFGVGSTFLVTFPGVVPERETTNVDS